ASTASTEDDLQAETISVELKAGEYAIGLSPGWYMQAATADGGFATVDATLTSANPQTFTIEDQETADVAFRFRVGGDIIVISKGSVAISIEVDDTPVAPNSTTLMYDPINAGDSAQWTVLGTGYNPVLVMEEITSPYDGGTALRTTVTGNTLSSCDTKGAARRYVLAEPVMSSAAALDLYIALDFNGTYYNWPWVELYLYSGDTIVGFALYYRLAATGGYRLTEEPLDQYTAIPNNGYQRLPIVPLTLRSDGRLERMTSPVAFDSFRLFLQNYACEGTNSVVVDNVSLIRLQD
ncbi:MAG TPA: hypothetical protein VIV60_10275, partial [Polyangiaceae bacterium]